MSAAVLALERIKGSAKRYSPTWTRGIPVGSRDPGPRRSWAVRGGRRHGWKVLRQRRSDILSAELDAADASARAEDGRDHYLAVSSANVDRLTCAYTAVAASTATPATTVPTSPDGRYLRRFVPSPSVAVIMSTTVSPGTCHHSCSSHCLQCPLIGNCGLRARPEPPVCIDMQPARLYI